MAKHLLLGLILTYLFQIRAAKLKKNKTKLTPSLTRCYGQLSSCTVSEGTNDPILRKLSDGQKDGQTDR